MGQQRLARGVVRIVCVGSYEDVVPDRERLGGKIGCQRIRCRVGVHAYLRQIRAEERLERGAGDGWQRRARGLSPLDLGDHRRLALADKRMRLARSLFD
jgi:hypothetical protein